MKKRSTVFLLLTLFIVCLLCTLTGCSSNKIRYVNQSFHVDSANFDTNADKMSISYSFDIKSSVDCEFNIKYVLAVINLWAEEVSFTKEFTINDDIKKGQTETYSRTVNFDKSDYEYIHSLMNNATIELQSINIERKKVKGGVKEEHDGYAVGFGIVSALLLAGLITLFVLDKRNAIEFPHRNK